MKLKLTALAVLATFAVGAHAASTSISNGDVAATIGDNGSFEVSPSIPVFSPGLSYKKVEFVNIDTPSAWWGIGSTAGLYTVAQYNGGGLTGSTTYGAGPSASTTLAINTGLSFQQTVFASSSNQLTVTVSFTNNGPTTLFNQYYGVGFDPDQGRTNPIGGSNATDNTVNGQGAVASVTAGAWNSGLYYTVTLANTTSSGAKNVAAYVNKGNCCGFVDPESVYPGTQSGFVSFADDSISLAYQLGDIASGQTVSIGYNYIFAAVPEPETYALFMAGLGLMGFVARRRMRA